MRLRYRYVTCPRCGGDLVLDGDEWRCWQCARRYYPKLSPVELRPHAEVMDRKRLFPTIAGQ